MNAERFAESGLLTPLQGLWRWFTPAPRTGQPALENRAMGVRAIATHLIAVDRQHTSLKCIKNPITPVQRPLRIVRILEADQAPASVGRMVVSGRMAEVCAELERLAAREAALH
jgi:hypothetical protein